MGFEPTTLSLANGWHPVSGYLTTSHIGVRASMYRLIMYRGFSHRWYINWYILPCLIYTSNVQRIACGWLVLSYRIACTNCDSVDLLRSVQFTKPESGIGQGWIDI